MVCEIGVGVGVWRVERGRVVGGTMGVVQSQPESDLSLEILRKREPTKEVNKILESKIETSTAFDLK